MPRSPKRGQRRAPLPRQPSQKQQLQPTQLGRQRILDYLQDTITTCDAALDDHGLECSCDVCCITSNMVGALRVFHMVLTIS